MNDPLLNTTAISTKVVLQARCYGNGVDLVIVDMRHRILLRSGLSFDNWGKFVSGREAVEMATMHAPVLHELVDQALAPLDHKAQIVPIEKPATPPPLGLEARAESFFVELFRLLQKHRVSLDVDTDLGVHFDDTYRPSACLLSDGLGIVDSATGTVMAAAEQARVLDRAVDAVIMDPSQPSHGKPNAKNDVNERDLETDETLRSAAVRVVSLLRGPWQQSLLNYIPDANERAVLERDICNAITETEVVFPPAKVTMDGVLSSASVSCKPTDPVIPTPPVDYSLAPALVDVKGMHRHRFADNPEEKRIAASFERDYGLERSNLRYLLRPASEQSTHAFGFISDRDREVAATMVQWLGSPAGQCFLRDLGYTIP